MQQVWSPVGRKGLTSQPLELGQGQSACLHLWQCWACACIGNVLKVKEGRGYSRQGITIPTGSPSCGPRSEKPYENPSVMASLSLFRMWATHNGLPRPLGLLHLTSKMPLDSSPPQFLLPIIPLWLHRPLCCSHFKDCPCSSLCLSHPFTQLAATTFPRETP